MRDFYDIYILEQLHGTTLNPKILHDALLATAHKRGSEKYLNQAEEVLTKWKMIRLCKNFGRHTVKSFLMLLIWNGM